MNNDLISREALKDAIENQDKFACLPDTTLVPFRMLNEPEKNYEPYVHLRDIRNAIDNAPTVAVNCKDCDGYEAGYSAGLKDAERPQGECKTCIHRDPEDKKCDCGALERAGCQFPVSDDYFCKFYEKGGAE